MRTVQLQQQLVGRLDAVAITGCVSAARSLSIVQRRRHARATTDLYTEPGCVGHTLEVFGTTAGAV